MGNLHPPWWCAQRTVTSASNSSRSTPHLRQQKLHSGPPLINFVVAAAGFFVAFIAGAAGAAAFDFIAFFILVAFGAFMAFIAFIAFVAAIVRLPSSLPSPSS